MGKPRKKHSSDHQPKGSIRRFEAIIFPIIIFILLGTFIVTKANGDDTIDENYLIASIAVCMALMVVSIPRGSPGGGRKKKAPKSRKHPSGKKPRRKKKAPPSVKASVVEEVEEEVVHRERKIISYPGAASGGKYGDAYIPISQEMILKVRSLLAVSCRNCKDVDTCWEKYKDQMDYDTFLESTECHEKMDPDIISAAPPVKVVEDGPVEVPVEEEGVVEVEEVAVEEEVAAEEESVDTGETADFDGEGEWDDSQYEGYGDEDGFDSGAEAGGEDESGDEVEFDAEADVEAGEDDDMAWD